MARNLIIRISESSKLVKSLVYDLPSDEKQLCGLFSSLIEYFQDISSMGYSVQSFSRVCKL